MSGKKGRNVLVTGVAGFVGSHLAERLIDNGHTVTGIDAFDPYYARRSKEANLAGLRESSLFTFIEDDLLNLDLPRIVNGIECVFHVAAQPGVRGSWGRTFEVYVRNNVLVTQRVLEATLDSGVERIVYASSSSVYGEATNLPIGETAALHPLSPYGVTKLAGEQLCHLYWTQYGLPVVALRYFTAYGPRQRPDMAFHKFIRAVVNDEQIDIYGDGSQSRDYTFVGDIVTATVKAMECDVAGEVINVGSGTGTTVSEVISLLETVTEKKAKLIRLERQKGDMAHTLADITKADRLLDYRPTVALSRGLAKEVEWYLGRNRTA